MHISKMTESKYLKQEDVGEEGRLVTIKSLERTNVAREDDEPEYKYVIHFHEVSKPLVLNATNIQLCARACGSEDTDDWTGKKIVLYADPNVSYAGKLVGGIRIRAPRGQATAGRVPPRATRADVDEQMASEAAAGRGPDGFEDADLPPF